MEIRHDSSSRESGSAASVLTPGARLAGGVGAVAAFAAIVADLSLQFTTNRSHQLTTRHLFLLDISPARLLVGHYLGVFAILLEVAGFWLIHEALRPGGRRTAIAYLLISALGCAVGAAFHASLAFLAPMVQGQVGAPPEVRAMLEEMVNSVNVFRAGLLIPAALSIIVGSLLFAVLVARGRTLFPRWMAAATPFTFIVLCYAVGRALPTAGLVLIPAGLNLAHLAFFSLALVLVRRRSPILLS